MNDRERQVETQVEATMDLLEHPAPLKAGPWFRTRTHNRLRRLTEAPAARRSWGLLLRPGLVAAVVILNFATFFAAVNPSIDTQDVRDTYLSTLASDYQLSASWELLETFTQAEEQ